MAVLAVISNSMLICFTSLFFKDLSYFYRFSLFLVFEVCFVRLRSALD